MQVDAGQRNKLFLKRALLVCCCTFLLGFGMVPIYRIACVHVFGIKFDDQAAKESKVATMAADTDRLVTVEFIANVNSALKWQFATEQVNVKVHPGVLTEVWFDATNNAATPIVGNAVPSIAPNTASLYFNKTECFCFTEQTLKAGESRRMPVKFVVDPKLPADISTLTLSYTFFNNELATKRVAAETATAKPAS